ncbi:CoA-binding protein [bacterium]|nr:CoA-binding protein [bacterium]
MLITDAEKFLKSGTLAVIGVSSQEKGFGLSTFRTLLQAGHDVVPVNPKTERIDGLYCYQNISMMKQPPAGVIMVTKPGNTMPVLEECLKLKIPAVWFQPGSESQQALMFCKEHGIKAYSGFCILLFAGGFPHSMHRWFLQLFKKIR